MIQFLLRLAKALPAQFGPNCEVVIHDLQSSDPDSSIVAIENGHVSGRKAGDGPSHVVLEGMNGGAAVEDRLSYLTKTADGKTLKSTTVYIRDEDQAPVGVFSINYDITLMLAMEETLRQFTSTASQAHDNAPEPIARNVSDLLDELIERPRGCQSPVPPLIRTQTSEKPAVPGISGIAGLLFSCAGEDGYFRFTG